MRRVLILNLISLLTLPFIFLPLAHAASPKNSLASAWFDETTKEIKVVDKHIDELDSSVRRLESEFENAQKQIKDFKTCIKLDCSEIEKLSKLIYEALEASNASIALSRIAHEELKQLAYNQSFSLVAIEKGKNKLARDLFIMELSQRAAYLSAGIAVALMTGGVTGAAEAHVQDLINYVAITAINYGFNQGMDKALGYKTALKREAQSAIGTKGKGGFIDTFAGSLASQLGNFNVIKTEAKVTGEFLRTLPKLKTEKLVPVFKDMANSNNFKMGASQAMQIATRAVVQALTESFVKDVRDDFKKAFKVHQEAFAGQRDLEVAALFGKVAIGMAQDRQRKITGLADRINKLAVHCDAEAKKIDCTKKRKQDLKSAQDKKERAEGKLNKESEAAKRKLEGKRNDWWAIMIDAATYHEQLRIVRDDLADAEYLNNNRSKIEELARFAKDANKRKQYQDELKRLEKLESPQKLKAKEKDLTAKHKKAWEKIDALMPSIEKERASAITIIKKNQGPLIEIEKAYQKAVSEIHNRFYKCLGTKVAKLPEATTPTMKELREKLSQEVDPGIIYQALKEKLKKLSEVAEQTKITARKKNGELCGPEKQAEASFVGDGECWNVHELFGGNVLMQKTGDAVRARVSSEKYADGEGGKGIYQSMIYKGSQKGKQLYLEHIYTDADRKFLREFIDPSVDDKIIDKLIEWKAKAVIKTSTGKDKSNSILFAPIPELGGGGVSHESLKVSHIPFNYDFKIQITGGFENKIKQKKGEYCVNGVCIFKKKEGFGNHTFFRVPSNLFLYGETKWKKLDPAWKHAGMISPKQKGFKDMKGIAKLGGKIWLETSSVMNCPTRQDEITVRVEPQKNPSAGFNVVLKETSKNSGIYRADSEGVTLDFKKKDVFDNFMGNINIYVPQLKELQGSGFFPNMLTIYDN